MPVSETLPYEWYETPNVHHCTITDFEDLCRRLGIRIRERLVLHEGKPVTLLPNLLGSLAVYRCTAALDSRARSPPRCAGGRPRQGAPARAALEPLYAMIAAVSHRPSRPTARRLGEPSASAETKTARAGRGALHVLPSAQALTIARHLLSMFHHAG